MTDHTHDELDDHGGRLVALEERIQRLEEALRDSAAGGATKKFVDSGSINPELDDQGIAP